MNPLRIQKSVYKLLTPILLVGSTLLSVFIPQEEPTATPVYSIDSSVQTSQSSAHMTYFSAQENMQASTGESMAGSHANMGEVVPGLTIDTGNELVDNALTCFTFLLTNWDDTRQWIYDNHSSMGMPGVLVSADRLDENLLTWEVVAGILANIQNESDFKPWIVQGDYTDTGRTDVGHIDYGAFYSQTPEQIAQTIKRHNWAGGSWGYGLMQWTYYSRRELLADFATATGLPINSLECQIKFIIYEAYTNSYMNGCYASFASKSHNDVPQAVRVAGGEDALILAKSAAYYFCMELEKPQSDAEPINRGSRLTSSAHTYRVGSQDYTLWELVNTYMTNPQSLMQGGAIS